MYKSTVRGPSQPFSGEDGEAANLQQLDPQPLDLHEDAVQGRAAAQAGADAIAVIRSTAQSLLDYVPH